MKELSIALIVLGLFGLIGFVAWVMMKYGGSCHHYIGDDWPKHEPLWKYKKTTIELYSKNRPKKD